MDIPHKSATWEVVSMERRKRRSFTPEFRAEAVRLVREGSKSLPQVAKDLDLTESAPHAEHLPEVRATVADKLGSAVSLAES
jgi:hypothetical protein